MKTSPKFQTPKFASKQKIEWESELFDKKKKVIFEKVNGQSIIVNGWSVCERRRGEEREVSNGRVFCSVEFICDDLLNK